MRKNSKHTWTNYKLIPQKSSIKMHNLNSEHNPIVAILIWIYANIIFLVGGLTYSVIVENVFKTVSLISVIMIICINLKPWTKVMKGFFQKKHKPK